MKRLSVLCGFCVVGLGACGFWDPVHDSAVTALGDEAPGVREGPTHRPGQPCLTCHDGAFNDPPEFTVAGTVYQSDTGKVAAENATVTITDATGKTFVATTNSVGNFYVSPTELTPQNPMKVAVTYNGVTVKMTSLIGRDGSCASCHFDPAGPTSAGHVYIPADGGAP